MKRLALTSGAALAIDPKCVQRDADGFFLMLGPSAPDNERVGNVAVVHVRGALAQYKDDGGDSYEGLEERVRAALEESPAAVVLRISSPGGVVAGLAQTTIKLRELCADVPLIAYVSELAASAAYHLCCACDEILAPPSAVVGSVGVISTMVSLAKQDRMQGVEYRLITSGARKADGHLHAPITDAAEAAERDRNGKLAAQFFDVVRSARGMSVAKVRGLEAGIYLAKDARKVGLIDDVASFDEVLQGLETSVSRGPRPAPNTGNVTDRRAKPAQALAQPDPTVSTCAEEDPMSVKLSALIAKTEAALAAEQDPRKRARLTADLAQYNSTRVAMESDPEEPGNGDDDGDDESKAAKAKRMEKYHAKKSEAAKHKAKAAEYLEKAKKCEEDAKSARGDEDEEEDDDEAAASCLRILATSLGRPALATAPALERGASAAALEDHVSAQQNKRIARLETTIAEKDKAAAIASALADGQITPALAKKLANKEPGWVAEYLDTTKEMRMANTTEGHLALPRDGHVTYTPDAATLSEIDKRIAQIGITDPAQVAKARADMIANRAAVQNGAGRY